jgi:hypothetical protein
VPRVIVLERIPATDPRLGRHIRHDSESWRWAYRATRRRALAAVRHERHVPVLDQGSLGSCVGNAAIGCLGTGPFYATVGPDDRYHTLDETDAVALYSVCTGRDPYPGQWPPEDTGTDGLTAAQVLLDAEEIAGYQHAFTLADALDALQDRPLITGINWYDGMFNPDPDGRVHVSGPLAGGHEIVVDEWAPDLSRVWMTNSWGTGWGVDGRFWMTAADWGRLLGEGGDVTIFTPSDEAPPTPTPPEPCRDEADDKLVAQVDAWSRARHVGGNKAAAAAYRAWRKAKGYR